MLLLGWLPQVYTLTIPSELESSHLHAVPKNTHKENTEINEKSSWKQNRFIVTQLTKNCSFLISKFCNEDNKFIINKMESCHGFLWSALAVVTLWVVQCVINTTAQLLKEFVQFMLLEKHGHHAIRCSLCPSDMLPLSHIETSKDLLSWELCKGLNVQSLREKPIQQAMVSWWESRKSWVCWNSGSWYPSSEKMQNFNVLGYFLSHYSHYLKYLDNLRAISMVTRYNWNWIVLLDLLLGNYVFDYYCLLLDINNQTLC